MREERRRIRGVVGRLEKCEEEGLGGKGVRIG